MNLDTESICRLCLQPSDDVVNIWSPFHDSTIASILSKHFWFQVLESDGMPEWLCQICWIQTKTFHNFYKRVEIRNRNYSKSVGVTCVDKIKTERNVSPVALEIDLNMVESEPTESTSQNVDGQTCEESIDDKKDDDICEESETVQTSDDETQPANIERNRYNSLSKCERDKQDAQIREYFNMKCDICTDADLKFETLGDVRKHYRKIHKTKGHLVCCGYKFELRFRMLNHIRIHHINPDTHHCDECGKNFTTKYSLRNHMKSHEPPESHTFKCTMCPRSFATATYLRQHVKTQHTLKTGEKFPCEKCDKNFTSSLLLGCHVRQVHDLTLKYVCEVCARQFKNKQSLRYHIGSEHSTTPRPKVQCNVCGAWLKHELSLRSHLQRHNDLKPVLKPVNCPLCDKVVRDKTLLYKHIAYVHGEKRYPCALCDKAFKLAKRLKEHIATHTGEDLYNCRYCDKKFKSDANMYKHRKLVHLAEWTQDCLQRSNTSTKVSVELNA